ncbi:MAG: OmpA family protein [Nitrospira sp.]|nr:OmpA family protein [Nitrospira sp.]
MPTDPHRPLQHSQSSQARVPVDEDWTQLRTLLLAPEQTQLDELRERLDNRSVEPRDVSRVLPEAFAIRGGGDQQMSTVLTPYVENGFISTVRKSPQTIVDAIAPIMGPAIRQAIVRALQSMTEAFNHSFDESLSIRGLQWRLEAWRTGRPFAEVVLLHRLRYRVDQVFLIQRDTGLLLHHVAADGVVVQDQHVLSGMLTAIQEYVRDSFGATRDQTLNQFQVGEWTVWVEQGSRAYLAGVIRGTPPASLREKFRDVLDRIHAEQADALVSFEGDAAPFQMVQPYLEDCLQAHYESGPSRNAPKLWILGSITLFACCWWGWTAYQAHVRWTHLLAQLKTEPGIVVTNERSMWGDHYLEGLRDPLAKDPSSLISEAGIDPSTVTALWSPFYALDPQLIRRRAQVMLKPPSTVQFHIDGDTLMATGSASSKWVTETRRLASFVPGVVRYNGEGLVTVSVPDLLNQINHAAIHFSLGSATVEPSEHSSLNAVLVALRDLDQAVAQSGQRLRLEVLGSADGTGAAMLNLQLSKQRAEAVLEILRGEHLSASTMIPSGIGEVLDKRVVLTKYPAQRIVTFRATIEPLDPQSEPARP